MSKFNKAGAWDSHVADEAPMPCPWPIPRNERPVQRSAGHFSQADYDRMMEPHNVPFNPAPTSGTIASGILREAADIVEGARGATHGDKERSFQAIAGLWTAYLAARKDGGDITALDVAWMMNLLKIARSVQGTFIRDHATDAAGYAAIAGELGL